MLFSFIFPLTICEYVHEEIGSLDFAYIYLWIIDELIHLIFNKGKVFKKFYHKIFKADVKYLSMERDNIST